MKVQTIYDDTLYQLVPKEPTRVMLNAAIDVDSFKLGDISPIGFRCSPQQLFERCYRSMLSAAPTPPAQPTRSQQMREKGFTRRDSGFVCDECGQPLAGVLQVQVHQCKAPAQPAERTDGMVKIAEIARNGDTFKIMRPLPVGTPVYAYASAANGIKGES